MTTIKVRRGTAAQWASAATVLAAGEQGLDTTNGILKVGDGSTAWASLGVANSGTYATLTEVRARDISALSYGLSTAGTASANQTALVAADTAAAAAGARLIYPAGTFNVAGNFLNLDADGRHIEGAGPGKTVFQVTGTSGQAIRVAYNTNHVLPKISGFTLKGPGSGTGIGIDVSPSIVVGELRLQDLIVREFGAEGIRIGWTDGLTLLNVRSILNGSDNLSLGANLGATNHASIIGSIFGNATGVTPPSGKAGILVGNVDGLTVIGSEFGYNDNGVLFDGVSGPTTCNFIACRWESNKTLDVSADTTGGSAAGCTFTNCMFLVTSTYPRTNSVSVKGVDRWRFTECTFTGLTAGGQGVLVVSGLTSHLVVESCSADAGTHVLTDSSAVNWDDRRIVIGGDYSNMIQAPYQIGGGSDQTVAAAATLGMASFPRTGKVTGVEFLFDGAVATNGSNYWTVQLHRYQSGSDQGIVGSFATNVTGVTAYRSVVGSLGAQVNLQVNDAMVLVCTPTGSPAANLVRPQVSVFYQPA